MRIKRALGDIVVVQLQDNYKTTGGVIVPGSVKPPLWEGTVIYIGPGALASDGVTRAKIDLELGQTVLFDPQQAIPYDEDGVKTMVMDSTAVFLQLEPRPENDPPMAMVRIDD